MTAMDALPRLLPRPCEDLAALGGLGKRARKGMSARQGETGGRLEDVRVLRIADEARLGEGEGAGLVEDHGVGLGEALQGVAAVEEHAVAEERAGRRDLHGRDREPQERKDR